MTESITETSSGRSRRRLLKTLVAAGAVPGTQVLAESWVQPLVQHVSLPAHARMSVTIDDGIFIGSTDESTSATDPVLGALFPAAHAFIPLPPAFDVSIDVIDNEAECFVEIPTEFDSISQGQGPVNQSIPLFPDCVLENMTLTIEGSDNDYVWGTVEGLFETSTDIARPFNIPRSKKKIFKKASCTKKKAVKIRTRNESGDTQIAQRPQRRKLKGARKDLA